MTKFTLIDQPGDNIKMSANAYNDSEAWR